MGKANHKLQETQYDVCYLEMISELPVLTTEDAAIWLEKLPNTGAKEQLTNGSLPYILETAKEFATEKAEVIDLFQEGCMALTLLLNHYKDGDFFRMREIAVRTAMAAYCENQKDNQEIGDMLAGSINVLNEVTTRMAEELGREATVEEIAEKMKMSEDKIRVLMRTAVDAVSVDPSK